MKKDQVLSEQLENVEKQEQKFLDKKGFISTKTAPIANVIREKIPDKFSVALRNAFYAGFKLVFEKGSPFIEKTYDKEKLQVVHDLGNYAVDKYPNSKKIKKFVKNIDRQSDRSRAVNESISVLEGAVLGVLGIGIPDIPLFLAVIVRTINETALSYGYRYEAKAEKAFVLYLICGAVSDGEARARYDKKVDLLGVSIDSGADIETDLEVVMKEASDVISNAIMAAKLIQSLPVAGLIGGMVNPYIISKVAKYSKLKYKKRYLRGKLAGR
jgi:hypothetical protein